MKNILKEISKNAEKVRLSSAEKNSMRETLASYVRLNPVVTPSPYVSMFSFVKKNIFRNNKTLPILVTLGILMGSSVSFAAEGATPGDTLYPVKIYVNENARGAVAFTPESRARWGVRLVERRLEEIEKITLRESITLPVLEVAESNFEKYTERVNTHIARLENKGDKEKALALSERLAQGIQKHEENFKENIDKKTFIKNTNQKRLSREEETVEEGHRERVVERIQDIRERTEKKNRELRERVSGGGSSLRGNGF